MHSNAPARYSSLTSPLKHQQTSVRGLQIISHTQLLPTIWKKKVNEWANSDPYCCHCSDLLMTCWRKAALVQLGSTVRLVKNCPQICRWEAKLAPKCIARFDVCLLPSPVVSRGSPDRSSFDADGLKMSKRNIIIHTKIKIKIKDKRWKRAMGRFNRSRVRRSVLDKPRSRLRPPFPTLLEFGCLRFSALRTKILTYWLGRPVSGYRTPSASLDAWSFSP